MYSMWSYRGFRYTYMSRERERERERDRKKASCGINGVS